MPSIELLEARLETHIDKDAEWKREHEVRWHQNDMMVKEVIALAKSNAEQIRDTSVQIKDTNDNVKQLTEDTQGMVEIYQDVAGTGRVLKKVQKGAIWVLKWGTIFAGFSALVSYLMGIDIKVN